MTMPADFARRGADGPPTLRSIVDDHAYDDAWVPDCPSAAPWKRPSREVRRRPPGRRPRRRASCIVAAACDAVSAVTDFDLVAHLSFGDDTVRVVLPARSTRSGPRAHEIAR